MTAPHTLAVVRTSTLLRILSGFEEAPPRLPTARALPEWAWQAIERMASKPRSDPDEITDLALITGRPRGAIKAQIRAVRKRGYRPRYRDQGA